MNPTFARQLDIDHVLHALKFLAPKGLLVSVVSAGAQQRTNAKTRDFHAQLARAGRVTWEDVEDGAFKESGTNVCTRIVTVDKRAT